MIIKVQEDPWVDVNERELLEARGTPFEVTAADLRAVNKELRFAQAGTRMEGMGNLVMRIPADLYFQEAINKPGCWEGEEAEKTLSRYWDAYADMRCIQGGNPWRKHSKKRG